VIGDNLKGILDRLEPTRYVAGAPAGGASRR
jgi:hypothetical protein